MAAISPPGEPVPEYRQMGPDIFDRSIDAEKLISRAINQATREQKRIVLLFGANWCPWCRSLHSAMTRSTEIVNLLNERFVLVYVDANTRVNKKRNAATLERFGNPIQKYGLPVFVVLASNGTTVATQETQSLAAPTDDEVARRLLALLRSWSGK